jgi:hypothetical protein
MVQTPFITSRFVSQNDRRCYKVCPTGFKHTLDGSAVLPEIQLVTDVKASSIHGQRPADQRIQNQQRDEFFQELTGSVTVGKVHDQRGETVGFVEDSNKVVARSL